MALVHPLRSWMFLSPIRISLRARRYWRGLPRSRELPSGRSRPLLDVSRAALRTPPGSDPHAVPVTQVQVGQRDYPSLIRLPSASCCHRNHPRRRTRRTSGLRAPGNRVDSMPAYGIGMPASLLLAERLAIARRIPQQRDRRSPTVLSRPAVHRNPVSGEHSPVPGIPDFDPAKLRFARTDAARHPTLECPQTPTQPTLGFAEHIAWPSRIPGNPVRNVASVETPHSHAAVDLRAHSLEGNEVSDPEFTRLQRAAENLPYKPEYTRLVSALVPRLPRHRSNPGTESLGCVRNNCNQADANG